MTPASRFRVLLLAALGAGAVQAQTFPAVEPVGLRGDVSGSWYDPAQSGHGLMLEVIDRGRVVLTWYTFDPAGQPLWLSGAGTVQGAALEVPVSTVAGGRFPPLFDPAAVQRQPWGTLRVEFAGCDEATLHWTPSAAGYAAGSMPLKRLSAVQGTRCNAEEEFGQTRSFAFERGAQGFTAVFADKPPGEEAFYELDFAHEPLPAPLQARRGLRLSGNNHSDDLAMLITAPIAGLAPDTLHRVEVEAELASDVPAGCAGVGGSPGEGLYLKLGATTQQPLALPSSAPDDGGWLRLNIDYGQQAEGGATVPVVGVLSNSHSCDEGTQAPWELKTVSTRGHELRVRSDAQGRLWVVAGSDSAFEGRTDYYFTALRVRLDAVAE